MLLLHCRHTDTGQRRDNPKTLSPKWDLQSWKNHEIETQVKNKYIIIIIVIINNLNGSKGMLVLVFFEASWKHAIVSFDGRGILFIALFSLFAALQSTGPMEVVSENPGSQAKGGLSQGTAVQIGGYIRHTVAKLRITLILSQEGRFIASEKAADRKRGSSQGYYRSCS